jgi:hypothetical protein
MRSVSMRPSATHETGHSYFAQTGHSHFAATWAIPLLRRVVAGGKLLKKLVGIEPWNYF